MSRGEALFARSLNSPERAVFERFGIGFKVHHRDHPAYAAYPADYMINCWTASTREGKEFYLRVWADEEGDENLWDLQEAPGLSGYLITNLIARQGQREG